MKIRLAYLYISLTILFSLFSYASERYDSSNKETLIFDEIGTLTFTTTDKKATTSTKYKTIGFTIFNETRTKSTVLMLTESSSKDLGNGNVETTFVTDKDTVFKRIGEASEEWQKELYLNGGTVILDGVFTIIENNKKLGSLEDEGRKDVGEVYYTIETIKGARSWEKPKDLEQYFNRKIEFPANPNFITGKAYIKHFTDTGIPLQAFDKKIILEEGENYRIAETNINGYDFIGSKIGYDVLPSGSLSQTKDYEIIYNGKNENIYIYYYYKYKDINIKLSEGAGVIGHNKKGVSIFDVTKGIPSGEKLYINVSTNKYIAQFSINIVGGIHKYTTSTFKGYDDNENPIYIEVVHEIPYSYYKIGSLEVYELDRVETSNYALPNGSITMTPDSKYYTSPTLEFNQDGGVLANGSNVTVWNDRLVIDGQVILDNRSVSQYGPSPNTLNIPLIHDMAIYKEEILIDKALLNKPDTKSSTTAYYKYIGGINGSGIKTINIPTNPVTIHTPVYCDGRMFDDKSFNQEIKPVSNRASIILGKSSKFEIITEGEHKNIPGYGNRDYISYISKKQARFPFDIYFNTLINDKNKFLPKNTWVDIPQEQSLVDIFIPTWVKEGDYEVEYRSIAINSPNDNAKTEKIANIDINNYIAVDSSPVRIIGRLYGFKISDIEDYPLWEEVFRVKKGSLEHNDTYYTVGLKNENGLSNKNFLPFTLPILNGSHPSIKNIGSLATGYTFKFECETIGDYYNDKDCIEIIPSFYYISKDGKETKEVDLWYSEYFNGKNNYFIKIGSDIDKENVKYIRLGDPDRGVLEKEIKETSNILGIKEEAFKNQRAKLGWFDRIILAKPLRTFIGNTEDLPTGIDANIVKKSVQHYYGEYYLPNLLYAAPKGHDVISYSRKNNGINGKESFWLKDGYIVVNFKIETIKNGEFENPILSYFSGVNANMWKIEGYQNNKVDYSNISFSLRDGDIVFYDLDKKASDDYNSRGTH